MTEVIFSKCTVCGVQEPTGHMGLCVTCRKSLERIYGEHPTPLEVSSWEIQRQLELKKSEDKS